jgi:four helix bundle protein
VKPQDLSQRTYEFGVAVVNFCKTLPDGPEARRIRGQLSDSGTAVAANYRGACRARSRAEFISKIAVCAEEADESHMWLRMCVDVGLSSRTVVADLVDEAEQLRRIFIASQLTAKRRNQR